MPPTIPATVTRAQWCTAYEAELMARYDWAADAAHRARFLASVEQTLAGEATTWNHDGVAVTAAWRACGGTGTPTLKALRALPVDAPAPAPTHDAPCCDRPNAERVQDLLQRLLGTPAVPTADPEDVRTLVVDTCATLRHVCDAYGLAFHELDREGYQHYLYERKHGA